MAHFVEHCWIDERHLGRRFPSVHAWLDAFAREEGAGHRRRRHHVEGVEKVRAEWGDVAAQAAELHIVIDMGHIPTEEDWRRGGVVNDEGDVDIMDAMGLLDSALEVLPVGIIVATATAYATELSCSGCNQETRHLLTDIRSEEFRCARCRSLTQYPDYRVVIPRRSKVPRRRHGRSHPK